MNSKRLKSAVKRIVKSNNMLIIPLGSLRRANQFKLIARQLGLKLETDATKMGFIRKRNTYHAVFYMIDKGTSYSIHTHPSIGFEASYVDTITM